MPVLQEAGNEVTGKLTRSAYEGLIAEDLAWLRSLPRTLERDHVIRIVEQSVEQEYGKPEPSPVEPAQGEPTGDPFRGVDRKPTEAQLRIANGLATHEMAYEMLERALANTGAFLSTTGLTITVDFSPQEEPAGGADEDGPGRLYEFMQARKGEPVGVGWADPPPWSQLTGTIREECIAAFHFVRGLVCGEQEKRIRELEQERESYQRALRHEYDKREALDARVAELEQERDGLKKCLGRALNDWFEEDHEWVREAEELLGTSRGSRLERADDRIRYLERENAELKAAKEAAEARNAELGFRVGALGPVVLAAEHWRDDYDISELRTPAERLLANEVDAYRARPEGAGGG